MITNPNLNNYSEKPHKYSGVVSSICDKWITVKDIKVMGSAGIQLKEQKFKIGCDLRQYIEYYEIDIDDNVEFYASVAYKQTADSKVYSLNKIQQIENSDWVRL
jgi:hypothetical protein